MRNILVWVLAVELLGLAVLPLLRAFFRNRRDAALLSRPLGLALVAYLAWVMTQCGLPFERGVVFLALILAGGASFWVYRRDQADFPPPFWSSEENRGALFFWIPTAIFLIVRAALPEILGQEKFMDLAFFNSLTHNTNMPPVDPWMSGLSINYYYWGYLLAAAITKFSNISTFTAYNLVLATFAGYTFAAAACLGLRLSKGRLAVGIGAGAATVFAGNLSGAVEGWNFFLGRGFNYFQASRVIGLDPATHDYTTISEFPFFTFFQADLHPHLLGLPFFVAAFAVAHRFLVRETRETAPTPEPPAPTGLRDLLARWSPAVLLALTAGTAIAANLWTLPAIGILLLLVCVFRPTRGKALPKLSEALLFAVGGLLLLLLSYEAWYAYEASFSLTSKDPNTHGLARNTVTSGLLEFLAVWGIQFAAVLAAVWPRPQDGQNESDASSRDLVVAASAVLSLGIALWLNAPAVSVLLWLCLLTGAIAWRALARSHDANDLFAACVLFLGLSMVAGCEFIHFKDAYGDKMQRMNTIFKFYSQAWPLIAVTTVVFAEKWWRQTRRRGAVAAFLAVCAFLAALYPAAAIFQRVGAHQGPWTLDARIALAQRSPADADAIAWLEHNVHGGAILMEATGDAYSEYTRMSTHTGIPTVMGWANHEGLWRENDPQVSERLGYVRAFYTAPAPALAQQILQRYHVSYVVLGDLEKRSSPRAQRIADYPFLQPVFSGPTAIFQVVSPGPK